jgi:hypothetical protein
MGITRKFTFDLNFEGDTYTCKSKRMNSKDGLAFDSLTVALQGAYAPLADAVPTKEDLEQSQRLLLDAMESMLVIIHKYLVWWNITEEDGESVDLPRDEAEFIGLCNELGATFCTSLIGSFLGGHRGLGKRKSSTTSNGQTENPV